MASTATGIRSGVTFAGTARSVTFAGVANGTGIDNITLESATPGSQYASGGLQQPIDTDVVNTAKAGGVVPVTYRLVDADGTPVSDPSSFYSLTSQSADDTCAGEPADAIETYAGGSGLQYLGDGTWRFNWKTPKTYAGQCRTMTLTLNDGSTYQAEFLFK